MTEAVQVLMLLQCVVMTRHYMSWTEARQPARRYSFAKNRRDAVGVLPNIIARAKKIYQMACKTRLSGCTVLTGAHPRGGGRGRGGPPRGAEGLPPWDLKNTIFSGVLPLNYAICILEFEVCFFSFLLCGRHGSLETPKDMP